MQDSTDTKSAGYADNYSALMGLDEFLVWCQACLRLDDPPEARSCLKEDLRLDDFEILSLVVELARIVDGSAAIPSDVFGRCRSIRELYLHYLTIEAMPRP